MVDYQTISRGRRFLPPFLNDLVEHIQVRQIEKALGRPIDVVWSFDPGRFTNLRQFSAKVRIFYAADRVETGVLEPISLTADVVLSVSDLLLEDFALAGDKTHFINHGLADEFAELARKRFAPDFMNDDTHPDPEPCMAGTTEKGTARRLRPRRRKVGYVGNLLRHDIDHTAFRAMVTGNPDAEFHVWGPFEYEHLDWKHEGDSEVREFVSFLRSAENVLLHGLTSPSKIAESLNEMNVLLICYDPERELNRGSNNHKVLEYLSTGKPVVTSHISTYSRPGMPPDLLVMPNSLDNASLPALLKSVLTDPSAFESPESQERRIRFALDNAYPAQLARIEAIVMPLLQ